MAPDALPPPGVTKGQCHHRVLCTQSDSFVESLRSNGRFPAKEANDGVASGDNEEKEPDETLAWTLFLRAELEEKTGLLRESLDTLEVR